MRRKTSVSIEENLWKAARKHCIDIDEEISMYLERLIKKDLKI